MKNSSDAARLGELLAAHRRGQLAQSLILSGDASEQDAVLGQLMPWLLCERGNPEGCSCRSCSTAWTSHPDVFELVPQTKTISLPDTHQVVEGLAVGPLWSSVKVVVIRPADSLGRESESYLLKHLEEPPAYVYYLLMTENPDRLMATIRSRCQWWRFGQERSAQASPDDLGRRLWSEPLTTERVVEAAYWVRRQYRDSGLPEWLAVWETLEAIHRQLEANGNADLALAQLRRVWPARSLG